MRKWRRRIARGLVILFACWVLLGIVLPSAIAWSRQYRIVSAIRAAQSVRVEEFQGERILARRRLNATQRESVIRSLPTILRGSSPFSLKLCFVPHHRIIARQPDGAEFTLTVCFGCDQAQHTGSGIYDLSPAGSAATRKFFNNNGILVHTMDEYAEISAHPQEGDVPEGR